MKKTLYQNNNFRWKTVFEGHSGRCFLNKSNKIKIIKKNIWSFMNFLYRKFRKDNSNLGDLFQTYFSLL